MININGKEFEKHKSGLYVSKDGEIFIDIKTKKYPNGKRTYGYPNGDGYWFVCHDNKKFRIHRLVAETYIDNPNNLPIVNHKDEDTSNNNVNNLEWCTHSYNINYGTAQQRRKEKLCGRPVYIKPINQLDLSGNVIATFKSISDAGRKLNLNKENISMCLNGKRKTHGGYKWQYA